jgi:hypothetical protein
MVDLNRDGLMIVEGFLTTQELSLLTAEANDLFDDKNFLNGSRRSIFLSRRPNLFYKSIQDPLYAFRSTNLLEICLRVHKLILQSNPYNEGQWILTNVDCFREKNKQPLNFHTDNRQGMIRGILYLSDADISSGSLKYIVGTHVRDYDVDHHLSSEKTAELSENIINCNAKAGDLVLFDSMGFHGNNPRLDTRTNIIFEFQPVNKNSDFPKSNLSLLSSNLSPEVLKNIDVFRSKPQGFHGQSDIWLDKNPKFLPTGLLIKFTLLSFLKDIQQTISSIPILNKLYHSTILSFKKQFKD